MNGSFDLASVGLAAAFEFALKLIEECGSPNLSTEVRAGLRVWIDYTNSWKNHPRSDQTDLWVTAKPLSLDATVEAVLKRNPTRKKEGGVEFNPRKKKVLSVPDTKKPSSRRIIFSRPHEEIKELSTAFFDRDDERPGIIGDKCFDVLLAQVRRQGGNE